MKAQMLFATCGFVLAAGLASAGAAPPAPLTLKVGTHQGSAGETVHIPIEMRGAQNLGPVQFLLSYDPKVLEPKTVAQGSLLKGAMLNHRVLEPGALQILLLTGDAINGDGPAFVADFQVLGKAGDSSDLKLGYARAWQRDAPLEMLVTAENGTFKVRGFAFPLWAWIAIGAAVLIVILAVIFLRRKKAPGDHNRAVSSRPGKLTILLALSAAVLCVAGSYFCFGPAAKWFAAKRAAAPAVMDLSAAEAKGRLEGAAVAPQLQTAAAPAGPRESTAVDRQPPAAAEIAGQGD
jgi:hypothetical protein